jgi:hypothetical protein
VETIAGIAGGDGVESETAGTRHEYSRASSFEARAVENNGTGKHDVRGSMGTKKRFRECDAQSKGAATPADETCAQVHDARLSGIQDQD